MGGAAVSGIDPPENWVCELIVWGSRRDYRILLNEGGQVGGQAMPHLPSAATRILSNCGGRTWLGLLLLFGQRLGGEAECGGRLRSSR
jgi:hypothetical protein